MTQKQLADTMNISDKTISKWERGLGCPDVSLLHELSDVLKVDVEKILIGELSPNDTDGGNMKKEKYYVCPECGNILTSTSGSDISCCGRKLTALAPQPANEKHSLKIEEVENEFFLTSSHDMSKEHYFSFISALSMDKMYMARLYPEQSLELRIPRIAGSKIYFYCNKHGLFEQKI